MRYLALVLLSLCTTYSYSGTHSNLFARFDLSNNRLSIDKVWIDEGPVYYEDVDVILDPDGSWVIESIGNDGDPQVNSSAIHVPINTFNIESGRLYLPMVELHETNRFSDEPSAVYRDIILQLGETWTIEDIEDDTCQQDVYTFMAIETCMTRDQAVEILACETVPFYVGTGAFGEGDVSSEYLPDLNIQYGNFGTEQYYVTNVSSFRYSLYNAISIGESCLD